VSEEIPSLESQLPPQRRVKPKSNKVEFRAPVEEFWIYESMAESYFGHGYIRKPTVSAVAKFLISLAANDYINKENSVIQRIKGVVPPKYFKRLIRDLSNLKVELSQCRKYNLRLQEKNYSLMKSLKEAQEKSRASEISSSVNGL
jgi:hypothetical protein